MLGEGKEKKPKGCCTWVLRPAGTLYLVKYSAKITCFFKNALVGMLAKAKVKPRRVAVVDLLRPDGVLVLTWDSAKMFYIRF